MEPMPDHSPPAGGSTQAADERDEQHAPAAEQSACAEPSLADVSCRCSAPLSTDDSSPAQAGNWSQKVGRFVWRAPGEVLIFCVRIYQWTLSPFIGQQCRFSPTCSNYYIQAVRKYGAVSGSLRGFWRICRCHPFHPGGYDPP